MSPTPKSLILNLLTAAEGAPLSASEAVGAASLFGIRENSVRVAFVRLGAAGLIESAGRGAYRLGPQAAGLAADLSRWRHAETRVVDWAGDWVMVCSADLGRSDRSALRVRQRALALLGFRPLTASLHVRPANLDGGAAGIRERLQRLGLEPEAAVFIAHDLAPALDQQARGLWDGPGLNRAYEATHRQLRDWLARHAELDLETAARESYLLGNEAIRQLVFDPLLPDPLVNVAARRAFTDTVIAFDRAGHAIWQRLLDALRQGHGLTGSAADSVMQTSARHITH